MLVLLGTRDHPKARRLVPHLLIVRNGYLRAPLGETLIIEMTETMQRLEKFEGEAFSSIIIKKAAFVHTYRQLTFEVCCHCNFVFLLYMLFVVILFQNS